jgi:hypothetical protein
MGEGKNDIVPPTPANPGGFEPLDLSGIRPAAQPQEAKSPMDVEFNAAYASLQSAIERGDKDEYVKGLDKLGQVMRDEVIGYHAPPKFGDLHHTFMEWQARNQYIATIEADRIKAGLEVNKNSDTLDNNLRPHHDIPGDTTMANNSKEFGGAVARYLNGRGHGYISGSVVPGVTEQNSAYMVQTTFKGFPKPPVVK